MPDGSLARRVLVLDDDPLFRSLVRVGLEAEGLDVLEAAKGAVARRMLAESHPDLVVVDGLLPDTNGVRWIEEVRAAGSSVPIVFVSAFYRDFPTFQHLTRSLGVVGIVAKPVDPRSFARSIAELLGASAPPLDPTPTVEAQLLAPHVESRSSVADNGVVLAAPSPSTEIPLDDATFGGPEPSRAEIRVPRVVTTAVELSEASRRALYVRVAVYSENPDVVAFVRQSLAERLVEIDACDAMEAFVARLASERPDAAIVALASDGTERIARSLLASKQSCAGVPILVLAEQGALGTRLWASRLGARGVLAAPIDADRLRSRLLELVVHGAVDLPRVLFFTADPVPLDLRRSLNALGVTVEIVGDGEEMLAMLATLRPELVVLGGAEGCAEWAAVIRSSEGGEAPAIVVLGDIDPRDALAVGIDDAMPDLASGLEALAAHARRVLLARAETGTCTLTHLPTRVALEGILLQHLAFCRRIDVQFTAAVVRVEGLARLQADHGRAPRDRLLEAIGHVLASRFRVDDVRGRWSRDTFVLGFGGATAASLARPLARLARELSGVSVRARGDTTISADVRIGAASFDEAGPTLESILRLAFARLDGARSAVLAEGLVP